MGSSLDLASPDPETIQGFFERIAARYDGINTLLSFRLDERWRARAASLILEGKEERILDLGVGTGRFLRAFLRKKSWEFAVGVDFARSMLALARTRLPGECELIQADIQDLPFEDASFDLVVSSFTLRSVKDRRHFFEEVFRVLQRPGKAAFLCLTRPPSLAMKFLYTPYLRFYLPLLGSLVSSDPKAYRFLSESIQAFPPPQEIAQELAASGFRSLSPIPFTFGIATLLQARK